MKILVLGSGGMARHKISEYLFANDYDYSGFERKRDAESFPLYRFYKD